MKVLDDRMAGKVARMVDEWERGRFRPQPQTRIEPSRPEDVRYSKVVCLVENFGRPDNPRGGNVGWSARALVLEHRPRSAVRDVIVTGAYDFDAPGFSLRPNSSDAQVTIPFDATAAEVAELCGYTNNVTVSLGTWIAPERDPAETGALTPLFRWRFEAASENANALPAQVDAEWGESHAVHVRHDAWVGTSQLLTVWDAIPSLPVRQFPLTNSIDELVWQNERWEVVQNREPVDGDSLVLIWNGSRWASSRSIGIPVASTVELARVRQLSDGTWMILRGSYTNEDGQVVHNETLGETPAVETQVRLFWKDDRWHVLTEYYRGKLGGFGTDCCCDDDCSINPFYKMPHSIGLICVVSWNGSAWVIVEREQRACTFPYLPDEDEPEDPYDY